MKTKKIISIICAVAILLTLTLNFQAPVFAQTPNLRFGAISDVHITSSDGTCEGARYFKKTLEYYKTRGVDAILIAGDITDSGQDYQTKTIANVFNEVFKDQSTRPQKIFVPGNHDRYNGKTFDKMQSDFATFLGEENGAYIHKVINGYDFIGISHGGNVTTLKNFVKNAIAEAIKRDPNKPIFFTQHEHLPNTVYGSEDWSDGTLYDILKNYPQIVTFSGHSHFTLIDERSINQKDFTSLGTSTLKYMELEYGKENGSIPPNASNVKEGLYIQVYNDKVDIERRSFYYDEQLGENWQLKLPLTKESFIYKNDRINNRKAPTFAQDAKIDVNAVKKASVNITFDTGIHDDFVHSYAIEAVKKGESKGVEKLIFSDFYLGTGRMNKKIDFNYSGLTPNTEYTIKVYAIESFGKRSIPLQTEIKTLESSITVDKFTPSVLDVNLSDGTLNDSTYNKTKAQLKGLPNIVFDEQLKKNVLKLDGKSHVNYYVDAEELSATQDHFTLESVFKVNKIQNQTIIENTQGAGLGFEMDANGNVELWAFIGGSYQKVGTKIEKDKYYHLLATFDGDKISIYLDGVLKGEKDVTGSLTNPSSNVPIALGADPDSSGDGTLMLDGNIALARIYSVAMNKDDVLVCLNNYKAMLNAKPIEINCTIKKPDNGLIKLFSDEKFENEITNLSSIKKGDIVYIYAKPNEGYLLKEITVNNEKIETTGYLVNKDCEFSASFEKLPEESYKIIIDETNKEKIEFYSDENFNNKINDITKIKKDSKIYIKTKLDDGYIIDYFIINDMQTTKNYFIINNDTKVDFKEYLKGDANGDNIIDTRDSLTILKHITQLQNIKNENMKSADFNQNGKIDTLDALGILKKLVNIE